MIDIVYLAYNRREFTAASLAALVANTDWSQVARVVIYDDGSTDGTLDFLTAVRLPKPVKLIRSNFKSPVAVMNDYLTTGDPTPIWAKVDSDTMLPPGWLSESLDVMARHPELDLLGIEAFNPLAPQPCERSYRPAQFIGGIGLLRTAAFSTLPTPGGRFGFTAWQEKNPQVVKGWINPSLPVFLLDRLPMEPWRSMSKAYVAQGWQREWPVYPHGSEQLWAWWKP